MKQVLCLLIALQALTSSAQTRMPVRSALTKNTLPDVTLTAHIDKEAEWLKSVASHIPLKGREPFYDTVVKYDDEFSRDDMDHNAEYFFRKMFNSKQVKLENNKHNFTGYGMYVFSTDPKNASPFLYKVYYTVDITVKGSHYYVNMHDFKLENQHAEVSFANLFNIARDNDTKAKQILAMFHNTNESELERINNIMYSKTTLRKGTASVIDELQDCMNIKFGQPDGRTYVN